MNERYSILQALRSCNVTKSPRNDDLPILPSYQNVDLSIGGRVASTGMADESERGARNGSSTDIQAYHMSAQHPFDPRFSLAFHARAKIKGGIEEEAAAGPAGKWQSARHQKVDNRSI